MGRREFLRRSLLVATVGLAGCNAFGGSEDVEKDYEPTAEDQLAIAVGKLNKAALAVSEFQDQRGDDNESEGGSDGDASESDDGTSDDSSDESDDEQTFDAEGPRERIATAREALTAAEETGDGRQADITAVRRYADSVEGTVDSVVNVTTASDHLEETRDILDTGEDEDVDTDAASAVLDDALTASSEAQTSHDNATTALESADGERLDAHDAEASALSDGLETLLGVVIGVDGLAVGYDRQVDGIDSLQTAQDDIDAEAFDQARESFTGAQSTFEEAATAFTDALPDAASELEGDLTEGDQRSRSLDLLSAGYVSVLDSRDHVKTAESEMEAENNETARAELTAGSEDATTATDRFDDGDAILDNEFTEEFNTARSRASALDSLSVGYRELLDGRDHLEEGESAFLDERYDNAETAFQNADQDGASAETTFTEGDEAIDEDLFDAEFDTAFDRTSVLRSLSQGYATVVQGRREAAAGREDLEAENFDAAGEQFETASDSFSDAEATFQEGQEVAGEQFGSAVDRALCQVGHLQSAMDHFIAAAEAGKNRNRSTLEDERAAGEEDLDRVEEC